MSKTLEISDEQLEERMQKIKPLIRFATRKTQSSEKLIQDSEGDLYFIADVGPNVPFTIEPTNPTRLADEVNPIPYKILETVHFGGSGVTFRPTNSQVLSQIPEEDLERCVAFETVYVGFLKGSRDHVAETRLYEQK